MKKYILIHVALGIVLSIVFLQCTPPKPTESNMFTQEEIDLPSDTTELKLIEEPLAIEEPAPIQKTKSVTKTITVNKLIPIEKTKPIDLPILINNPVYIEQVNPIEQSLDVETLKTIDKPVPVAETVSLKSLGFTLKLLKATINGTSTLHDWESKVTEVKGKGSFLIKENSIASIQDGEFKITVRGIISTEGKKMDNKTYEAFNSDENPFIIYTFSKASIKINASNAVSINVEGQLNMAGSSQSVSLSANGTELPNGDLHLNITKKIKMSDYKMKPPVMFLGTIKVGDEITVNFDFELKKVNN